MKIAIMGKIHPDGLTIFEKNNIENFEIENFEEDSLIKNLSDVDGIVIRTANLTSKILSKCRKLKIVSRHGVGYDNVDSEYIFKNNIALAITGTSNAVSVAEHVMTMFLYLTKKIHLSNRLVKSGNFKNKSELPNFFELYKKKILILGFGRIGQELAKRCLGFDMEVYIHDPYVSDDIIKNKKCNPIKKKEGFELADYISIHLPLNDSTRNFINFDDFNLFKKNLILVNTARGGIVNEKALFDALKNNKINSAGLDVFETEPPIKDHPLFKQENIILTPHNAALTLECRKRMSIESCMNVFNYLKNIKELNKKNIVNLSNLNF